VVAATVFLTALVGLAPGQVLVAVMVAGSAALPDLWRPRPRWSLRPVARPAYWVLDALVVVGLVASCIYAQDVLALARSGAHDENTLGLVHLPVQAAFGLAVSTSAAVAVLTLANRADGWWLACVPAVLSAVWFGAVARAYPDHLASTGRAGSTLTIAWGVGLLLAALGTELLVRARHP
jgi:hypothetical protein